MGTTVYLSRNDEAPVDSTGQPWQKLNTIGETAMRCYKTIGYGYMTKEGKPFVPKNVPNCYVTDAKELETDDAKMDEMKNVLRAFTKMDSFLKQAEYMAWLQNLQPTVALAVTKTGGGTDQAKLDRVLKNWQLTSLADLTKGMEANAKETTYPLFTNESVERLKALFGKDDNSERRFAIVGVRTNQTSDGNVKDDFVQGNPTFKVMLKGSPKTGSTKDEYDFPDFNDDGKYFWPSKSVMDNNANPTIAGEAVRVAPRILAMGSLGWSDLDDEFRGIWLPRNNSVIPEKFRRAADDIRFIDSNDPNASSIRTATKISAGVKEALAKVGQTSEDEAVKSLARALLAAQSSKRIDIPKLLKDDADRRQLFERASTRTKKQNVLTQKEEGTNKAGLATEFLDIANQCIDLTRKNA